MSKTIKKFSELISTFQRLNHETKLCQDPQNLQINSKDIFYVLSNNFSYTQLFFLFLLQKDFGICLRPFFCLFSSSERLIFFCMLLFKAFLCVFDNIYLPFLYTEKKNIKNIFISFFICLKTNFKIWKLYELCKLYESCKL